jgi:hypothetical protein
MHKYADPDTYVVGTLTTTICLHSDTYVVCTQDYIFILNHTYVQTHRNELPSVGYQNKGYPQSTIKKNKPLRKPRQKLCPRRRDEPKRRTKHLDHVPTRTRLARRDASTMFRFARGLLDKTPRPPRKLRLARPWVELVDPPHSLTLRQKSEHLMQPSTTSYPHGYSNNRHGSSTSVKSHFLLPIPGRAVKTCHCTRHTGHCSTTDPP